MSFFESEKGPEKGPGLQSCDSLSLVPCIQLRIARLQARPLFRPLFFKLLARFGYDC